MRNLSCADTNTKISCSLYVITSHDKYHEHEVFHDIAYRLAFLMISYLS